VMYILLYDMLSMSFRACVCARLCKVLYSETV